MRKIWLILFIFLAACVADSGSSTPIASNQPAPLAMSTVPITRAVATPLLTDTPIATTILPVSSTTLPTPFLSNGIEPHDPPTLPTRIPTPTPEYTCPIAGTAETAIEPESINSLKNSILIYLNAGSGWDALSQRLSAQNADATTTEVDFNGDGVREVVMSIRLDLPQYNTEWATWVFQCRDGGYEVTFELLWGYHDRERIAEIIDLNNDSLPEVVIEYLWVGSACTYELTIIGWQPNRGFVDYAPSYLELDFGCGGEITIDDLDGDNVQEIIIRGETVGHQSYAPFREIIQKYQLIGQSYQLIETEYLPSTIRVHIFDDAQRALDSGDILLAAQLYDQAAHDFSLESYPSQRFPPDVGYSLDHPDEYQRSFALFRLAVIHYHLGNTTQVNNILVELNSTFPENSFGNEFAILTDLYVEERENNISAIEACQKVTVYIEENYPTLDAHIGDWGNNIASYNNGTICPVLGSHDN